MKIDKSGFLPNRRKFSKTGLAAGIGMAIPWRFLPTRVFAATPSPGLSKPVKQPKFEAIVPNALDPGLIYNPVNNEITVGVGQATQMTGLVGPNGQPVSTTIWGYGITNCLPGPAGPFSCTGAMR